MKSEKVIQRKKVFLLVSLATLIVCRQESHAVPEALTPSEYGSIYVMEKQQRQVLPWRVGLSYGYEFGNPYLNTMGGTFTFEKSWGRYVWLGFQATKYFSSSSQLMQTLKDELGTSGIGSAIKNPNYSIYPIVTFVPLSGHLNFLGAKPLAMELAVRLGGGYVSYLSGLEKGAMLWSIRPGAHIDQNWSLQTGVGQEIESPFQGSDSLSRLRIDAGVGYQF